MKRRRCMQIHPIAGASVQHDQEQNKKPKQSALAGGTSPNNSVEWIDKTHNQSGCEVFDYVDQRDQSSRLQARNRLQQNTKTGHRREATTATRRPAEPQPPQPSQKRSKNPELGKLWIRTREKERMKLNNLKLDVMQLQQEIQRLEHLKQILVNRTFLQQTAKTRSLMRVVRRYYETFQFGFLTPRAAKPKQIRKVSPFDQADFLRSIMAPDVRCGRFCGVEAQVDQWRRYSEYMAFLNLRLMSWQMVDLQDLPIVKTTGELVVRLTRRSLHEVFPHVLRHDSIVQRLIGLTLQLGYRLDFFFDGQGSIIRLESNADFLTAFGHLFEDPKEVVAIMNHARISPENFLGETKLYQRVQEHSCECNSMNLDYVLV